MRGFTVVHQVDRADVHVEVAVGGFFRVGVTGGAKGETHGAVRAGIRTTAHAAQVDNGTAAGNAVAIDNQAGTIAIRIPSVLHRERVTIITSTAGQRGSSHYAIAIHRSTSAGTSGIPRIIHRKSGAIVACRSRQSASTSNAVAINYLASALAARAPLIVAGVQVVVVAGRTRQCSSTRHSEAIRYKTLALAVGLVHIVHRTGIAIVAGRAGNIRSVRHAETIEHGSGGEPTDAQLRCLGNVLAALPRAATAGACYTNEQSVAALPSRPVDHLLNDTVELRRALIERTFIHQGPRCRTPGNRACRDPGGDAEGGCAYGRCVIARFAADLQCAVAGILSSAGSELHISPHHYSALRNVHTVEPETDGLVAAPVRAIAVVHQVQRAFAHIDVAVVRLFHIAIGRCAYHNACGVGAIEAGVRAVAHATIIVGGSAARHSGAIDHKAGTNAVRVPGVVTGASITIVASCTGKAATTGHTRAINRYTGTQTTGVPCIVAGQRVAIVTGSAGQRVASWYAKAIERHAFALASQVVLIVPRKDVPIIACRSR